MLRLLLLAVLLAALATLLSRQSAMPSVRCAQAYGTIAGNALRNLQAELGPDQPPEPLRITADAPTATAPSPSEVEWHRDHCDGLRPRAAGSR